MENILTCPIHGEYESISYNILGRIFEGTCPLCEKEEAEKEKIEAKQREALIDGEKRKEMASRGIEPEYFTASLSGYIPENESQSMALEACRKLQCGEIKKVILTGPNGIGKTYLASALAKDTDGIIVTIYYLGARIREGYQKGKSELEILEKILSHPLIVLDEVGRSKGSEAEFNWLSYLIDKAHVRGIKLILISNLSLARNLPAERRGESLEYYLPNDVISRLCQYSEFVEMEGDDYRRK